MNPGQSCMFLTNGFKNPGFGINQTKPGLSNIAYIVIPAIPKKEILQYQKSL
jgi:hypothetical protein